ncbi:putative competence/damage-inducible protein CinA, partial [Cladorrhinum sp. PSN332]
VARQLVSRLSSTGATLAVAESLTSGLVMSAIASVPGASSVFRGGVVSYATELKRSLLNVDADLIACEGVIHEDVAAQMAEGVRKTTSSAYEGGDGQETTWGLGTTGVAGPGKQDGKEVGTVFVAVSYKGEKVWKKGFRFRKSLERDEIRRKTVVEALTLLVGAVIEMQ